MRAIVTIVASGLLALLAGCSQTVVPPHPQPSAPTSVARAAAPPALPQVQVATLPPAPPLGSWIEKSRSDFQMTLDLNMQTQLIELGVPVGDVDEEAAQSLAYMICSHLRAGGRATVNDEVRAAYPTATNIDAIGIVIAAQAYCLDTV